MNAPKTQKRPRKPATKKAAADGTAPTQATDTTTQPIDESTLSESQIKALAGHHQALPSPTVNVGTIGHVEAGKSTLQTVLDTAAQQAEGNQEHEQQVLLCALLIKAKSRNGFWRCKRHWSHAGCHALVVPDGEDIDAIRQKNPEMESVFITEAEYQRLATEPHLVVEQLEPDALEDESLDTEDAE